MIVVLVLVAVIKASDTHVPSLFLLYALEFLSSMHDRCFVLFKYYSILRTPSSV